MKNAKLGGNTEDPSEPGGADVTVQPHVDNDGGGGPTPDGEVLVFQPKEGEVIYID